MKRIILHIILFSLSVCGASTLRAQDFYVSLNALQLANLGTMDFSFGVAVARHWTVDANVRLNLWHFGKVDESAPYETVVKDINSSCFNQRESGALGVRYWPWYTLSGFWVGARGQAVAYDRGGWIFKERHKGVAYGGCLGAGWSWMLNPHLNLDFGVYGWAGKYKGRTYEDLYHTNRATDEEGSFLTLDEIIIGIVYVF